MQWKQRQQTKIYVFSKWYATSDICGEHYEAKIRLLKKYRIVRTIGNSKRGMIINTLQDEHSKEFYARISPIKNALNDTLGKQATQSWSQAKT